MARRVKTGRIEPNFGGVGKGGLSVSPGDRPGRAPKPPGGGRKISGQESPAARRKAKRGGGARPRRSLLGRLFRGTFYWGAVLSLWCAIAVAGLVAYYAAELPGAEQWR